MQRASHVASEPLPNAALIDFAKAVRTVLATRILLLIVTLTTCGIWSYTAVQPSDLRILASGVFTCLTLWPMCLIYVKKG